MFWKLSQNEKISKRQIRRLLFWEMSGITTLMLPRLLIDDSGVYGVDGIFAIIIAGVLQILYLKLLAKKSADNRGSYFIEIFYILAFLLFSADILRIAVDMINTTLLQDGSWQLIGIILIILICYGSVGGVEGRARMYEVLHYILLVPLVSMIIFAIRDVDTYMWCPIAVTKPENFICGIIKAFGLIHLSSIASIEEDVRGKYKQVKKAIVCVVIINVIIYLVLIGIFTTELMGIQKYSILILMSMIKIPGGFLKRQDAIMMAVWSFALYALLNAIFSKGREKIQNIFDINKNRSKGLVISVYAVLIYVVMYIDYKYIEVQKLISQKLIPSAIVISVIIIPLYSIWKNRSVQK